MAEGEAQMAPVHVLDGNCNLRWRIHLETHSKYADDGLRCEFIAAPLAKYSDRRLAITPQTSRQCCDELWIERKKSNQTEGAVIKMKN